MEKGSRGSAGSYPEIGCSRKRCFFHHLEAGTRARQHLLGEQVDPARSTPHVDLLEDILPCGDAQEQRARIGPPRRCSLKAPAYRR
jgi:hypothetical protein